MGISKIKYQTDSLCTSIVYTLDPDERIDAFTNGMLINNNIRGILAQSFEINNNVMTLSYNITRGIPLSTLIRQSLKKEVILTILRNIADILVRAEEYMLDVDKMILEDDYIFVDTSNLEASMILIPTNKPYGKPFRAFIKSCIVTGVFDLSEDASYVMQINNFLNVRTNASVKEIAGFLDKLLNNKAAGGIPGIQPAPGAVPGVPQMNPVNVNPAPQLSQPIPVQKQQPAPAPIPAPAQNPQESAPAKKGLFGGVFDKKEKKPAKEPAPSGFAGMQIPGMNNAPVPPQPAKPEKQKPAKPDKPVKPEKQPKQTALKPFMKNNQPMPIPPGAQQMAVPPMGQQMQVPPVQQMQIPPMQQPMPQQMNPMPQQMPNPAAQMFAEPNIMSGGSDGSESTVMLGERAASTGEAVGFLEQRNGTSVPIDKDFFFIGKGTNTSIVNNLVIRNENVSRNHAVIERSGGRFYVKDNNSMNGTFVNGQRITPNIRTEIRNGDVIVFANEEYAFTVKRV